MPQYRKFPDMKFEKGADRRRERIYAIGFGALVLAGSFYAGTLADNFRGHEGLLQRLVPVVMVQQARTSQPNQDQKRRTQHVFSVARNYSDAARAGREADIRKHFSEFESALESAELSQDEYRRLANTLGVTNYDPFAGDPKYILLRILAQNVQAALEQAGRRRGEPYGISGVTEHGDGTSSYTINDTRRSGPTDLILKEQEATIKAAQQKAIEKQCKAAAEQQEQAPKTPLDIFAKPLGEIAQQMAGCNK